MNQTDTSCPLVGGSRNNSFSVAAIAIITLLSALSIVLLIMLATTIHRSRPSYILEPMSELRGLRRASITSTVSNHDESWIHPAWLASSTADGQLRYPMVARVPPALSALNSSNVREKRLNLVRHSLLSSAKLSDWNTFDTRGIRRQQMNKARKQDRDSGGDWPLWL